MQRKMPHFSIPTSLHDLENEPYNLLPYPVDFNDEDEGARIRSFDSLVQQLTDGNAFLSSGDISIFEAEDDDEDSSWLDSGRIQALYTLVRKSSSLLALTRQALAKVMSDALYELSVLLEQKFLIDKGEAAPQAFRDAFACHVYMLYSFMFLYESDAKGKDKNTNEILAVRQISTEAMLRASETMAAYRNTLWVRGVPDEAVVLLPCRIAYPMLELLTGVLARKACCGDQVLRIISVTINSNDFVLNSVTTAIMDLMHSFEHMAAIAAELCTMIVESPFNRLAFELLREFGRLDYCDLKAAVGVKNVAPFVSELAILRPGLVLSQISHIVPLLNAEQYSLRSSIVTAIGHVSVFLLMQNNRAHANGEEATSDTEQWACIGVHKSVNPLLHVLGERCHDTSSYTRAAAVKAWSRLSEASCIPKERIIEVTRHAMDRVLDKTVVVRKAAMQLLTSLLRNNPFMGKLDPKPFKLKIEELSNIILDNLPEHLQEARASALQEGGQRSHQEVNESTLAAAISEADIVCTEATMESTVDQQEYYMKIQALKFAQAALEFINLFEKSSDALEGMLLSTNASDVSEALRFFVKARHFDLPCAVTGMKRALLLMWSTEPSIREEVLKAFIEVFISLPGSEGLVLLPAKDIAMNLVKLVQEATVSEAASIEEAISCLVKDDRLSVSVFKGLWSISSTNPCFRSTVIQIISMGASASRTIIDCNSRLKVLLDDGLLSVVGTSNDWDLARNVAICLQRLCRATSDGFDSKFLVLDQIVDGLCNIVAGEACTGTTEDTLNWFSASEQSIKAIFVICPEPERVCNCVILNMVKATFQNADETNPTLGLARFCHVLGCVAISLLVYSEALISTVRRATSKKSLQRQEESEKSKQQKKIPATTNLHAINCDDEIEAELGVAAAAEAENEQKLFDISENEILGRGLVSQFIPLLIRLTSPENQSQCQPILAQSSMLALCKFMCVSSSFCEKYLALVFTGLANNVMDDVTLRANTVVALGDVAFRFPNQFEPYTSRLYACLQDSSTKVRRHTLMVLTHLILNDMIKVKGQVSEIALCLRDMDQRVRDMSRLLFHELSKRSNNPIYNLLPDIISQLSQKSVSNEDYRHIMSILLAYITKDRQFELLTEKLCQRFPTCTTVPQKSNIAYCLSQIRLTDKCIKCLVDNFKTYKDSLCDEEVVKSFILIISKAKKLGKPEMKDLILEWESKLQLASSTAVENLLVTETAVHARANTSRKNEAKTGSSCDNTSKKKEVITFDEDEKENHLNMVMASENRTRGIGLPLPGHGC